MRTWGRATAVLTVSAAVVAIALAIGGSLSVSAASQDCFPDVSTADWYHDFVCWMYDNGLATGYPDGFFKPHDPVTRAEMAVFAQRGFELAEANDDDALAALSCASGEIPEWNGSAWACAADDNGPGLLKAVVFALCNPTPSAPSQIYRAENNENSATITIDDGVSMTDGRCVIDFGFQVDDRFVVATARHPTTPLGVTIVSLSANTIEIFVWHGATGTATGGPIMVMVY